MPLHLANWRSIFTLGSKLKDLGGRSFPKEIVNTPNVHSFGRIYPNLEYIRACCIKNSFYNVKENYSKTKNNLLSYTTLENQAFLIFFLSACAQMNIFTCSNDSTELILYSAFITQSFGFFKYFNRRRKVLQRSYQR